MVPPKKRTADEAWNALEKMDVDDEVDRVLGLSEKELDDELAKGGVDPKGVRERGRAMGGGKSPPAKVVSIRRARWVALLAAALGMFTLFVMMGGPEIASSGRHEHAVKLRAKASAECAASRWPACLGDLNQARDLDPAGEQDDSIRALRRAAEASLGAGDAGR